MKFLKKIAKKFLRILPVPPLDWTLRKLLRFYEIVQYEKEGDMANRKQVSLNFSHYLQNTEGRIERLRRIINKRPVAILLRGPSIAELEERITELADCDICYFTSNVFGVQERNILKQINQKLSLIICAAAPGAQFDDIIAYLERPEDNVLLSEKDSFHRLGMPPEFDYNKFIGKYNEKLLFFKSQISTIAANVGVFLEVPNREYPLHFPLQNSFAALLSLAIIGEAPLVAVFGGDGGRINTVDLHYRETDPEYLKFKPVKEVVEHSIVDDTKVFNLTMPSLLTRLYEVYNLRPVDIINCSERSHYTPLRKLSYAETFEILKSFKVKE
ncbi:hypothetical protein ACFLVJ_02200 [Chloroflexota bacterium]